MYAFEETRGRAILEFGHGVRVMVRVSTRGVSVPDGILGIDIVGGRVASADWYPSNLDISVPLDGEAARPGS